MARYTLAEATAFYEAAKSAYLNALTNKSYSVSGRNKENQDIDRLRKDMERWKLEIDAINIGRKSSGPIVKTGVPIV